MNEDWSVYIVECSDGTFYCGVSNDVEKRIEKHNNGIGAKYTRPRLPVKLLASRNGLTKSHAMAIEYMTKKKPKERKISFMLNVPVPKKGKQK